MGFPAVNGTDSLSVFLQTYSDVSGLFKEHQTTFRGYFYNDMRYINLRFTYLLTYLLTFQIRKSA